MNFLGTGTLDFLFSYVAWDRESVSQIRNPNFVVVSRILVISV